MENKMKINHLTFLGFYLNGAQGNRSYDHITIDVVKNELKKGTIFSFLENELGNDIDTSIIEADEKKELNDQWYDMSQAIDEGRKLCVDNGGLCLLVAYILEGIQRLNRLEK
jgi:hypothetical protein